MFRRFAILAILSLLLGLMVGNAAGPETFRYQVTGLFSPDREQDLREVVAEIPQVKVQAIDFKNAEATFVFDPAVAFPGAKPDQVRERLDNQVRTISRSTFGLRPVRTTPLEKLRLVEIRVAGLDCKACSLAAYEAIYKLDGVERATASFREGRVTAHIDPARTDRGKLEEALQKRGVEVVKP